MTQRHRGCWPDLQTGDASAAEQVDLLGLTPVEIGLVAAFVDGLRDARAAEAMQLSSARR
ncbi:hypothetical protein ACIGO9_30615 [Nocardia asteroides]|uniref:hypothetical protein n=1 Tax=Nocardia asteroides TaxID=1824 RepID=UPI0037CC0F26